MKKRTVAGLGDPANPRPASKPKYQHVRDHFLAEITSGRLAPGEALPPESKLAEMLGLSRNTIRLALGELETQGVVYRVQGRGTFVSTEQQRQSRKSLQAFALVAPVLTTFFYPSLVAGFEEFCSSASYHTLVRSSMNDVYRQGDQILQFIDQRISGLAIVPVGTQPTPPHQIRQLHEHHIPVVYCHRAVPGVSAPCVTWSGETVGHTAGKVLLQLGHRRILSLFPYEGEMASRYVAGLKEAYLECKLKVPDVLVRYHGTVDHGPESLNRVRSALHEILSCPERPTAIFCGNMTDAEHVYLLASEFGLRVPDDLSIIHFGGAQRSGALAERLACVAVDEHQLGAIAGRLLTEMRNGKRSINSDEKIVLPITLLPGETLAPPPTTVASVQPSESP
jgi:GntR family transcriptional regulator, arabinose operon transcriptional repressor